jgi:diguanylate cyclase (GGDEF)-like protein
LQRRLFARIFRASITNERELVRYVAFVSIICVTIALTADVVNQLIFFADWATCLRNWAVTASLTLGLSIPIARAIGKANLELHRAKTLADSLARTDQLTGLPNRRAMLEAVDRAHPEALALVIVDIDRFKRVNDTHGHLAGDIVIRSVGKMVAADLGALGFVARIGGEEFALLSFSGSSRLLAAAVNAFREKIEMTPIVAEGAAIRITISAGVAVREAAVSFAQLFSEADRALYAAKAAGRNRVWLAPTHGADDGAEGKTSQVLRSA